MAKKDTRIDAYIAKSASYAKPILKHFRELVHTHCPEVEETIKWSVPFFDYKGGSFCSMAAFKEHCAIGFWKANMMKDLGKMEDGEEKSAGSYGRITTLDDLPADKIIIGHIKEAMKLNEAGVKLAPKKKPAEKTALQIPAELISALNKSKKAKAAFENFSPSHKREYATWIAEAKSEETRNKRIETAIEWMTEGKSRHWKYARK
ncbi:MAG TPA: YdeI/OmpD-associated family protein [Chitinophagales bacterium]|nr:YdeI/OmpD-associated family protein [Chitinophagales bacterium]